MSVQFWVLKNFCLQNGPAKVNRQENDIPNQKYFGWQRIVAFLAWGTALIQNVRICVSQPPEEKMEQKCEFEFTDDSFGELFVVIFAFGVEPEQQPFVEPVDDGKVYGRKDNQNRETRRVRKSYPD